MLIDAALENGAIGAKLTGAGSGGSVFALTLPGNESRVAKAWERKLAGAGLESARISRPRISRRGLVIQVG